MSEVKWIKITTSMFEDEKIKLIDAMPERDTIHYIWIRLLVQAGKTNVNGFIFLNENIPYTEEMLSTIFCRPLNSIRLALNILKSFGMIEMDENNYIKISNWEKYQNVEGMERIREQTKRRVEKCRERKKNLEEVREENKNEDFTEENSCNATNNHYDVTRNESNVTVTEQNKKESEIEIREKNKKDIESESKKDIESESKKDIENDKQIISDSNSTVYINNAGYKNENLVNSKDMLSHSRETKNLGYSNEAAELLKYYEQITGSQNGLNLGALKLAISTHGQKYVKMAIDRALEVNKDNMTYINGILKNWKREGYPKEKGEKIKNGDISNGESNKADKNKFGSFKPKKPRNLTESERKGTEEKLI